MFKFIILNFFFITFQQDLDKDFTPQCYEDLNTQEKAKLWLTKEFNFIPRTMVAKVSLIEVFEGSVLIKSEKITTYYLRATSGECSDRFRFGQLSSDPNTKTNIQIEISVGKDKIPIESLSLTLSDNHSFTDLDLHGSTNQVVLPITIIQRGEFRTLIQRNRLLEAPKEFWARAPWPKSQFYCLSFLKNGHQTFSTFEYQWRLDMPFEYLVASFKLQVKGGINLKPLVFKDLAWIHTCESSPYNNTLVIQDLADNQEATITIEKARPREDLHVVYGYNPADKTTTFSGNWKPTGVTLVFESSDHLITPLDQHKVYLFKTKTFKRRCVHDGSLGTIIEKRAGKKVLHSRSWYIRKTPDVVNIQDQVQMDGPVLTACLEKAFDIE